MNEALTSERTLETLRGTLTAEDLPPLPEPTIEDARLAFMGQ